MVGKDTLNNIYQMLDQASLIFTLSLLVKIPFAESASTYSDRSATLSANMYTRDTLVHQSTM